MSQVDFTLEDIRLMVHQEVRQVVEESEFRIVKTVKECFDVYDERFNRVDERFDEVDERFASIDKRFDAMDKRFDAADKRFDKTDIRLDGIAADVQAVKRLVGQHSQEIMELKARPA